MGLVGASFMPTYVFPFSDTPPQGVARGFFGGSHVIVPQRT
jgi:hypothetical protein